MGSLLAQGTQTSRPMFLTGNVTLADGSPVPERVEIHMVCQGQAQPQGWTDREGNFSFQIGQNRGQYSPDPGTRAPAVSDTFGGPQTGTRQVTGMTERSLIGCGLIGVLEGYRSSTLELSGRRAADNPKVGTILLSKHTPVEGQTVSLTSLQAPQAAVRSYENGVRQSGRKRFSQAEEQLRKAVESYPDYAEAWQELGVAQQAQDKLEEARESFERAITADRKYIRPYQSLMVLSIREQRWEDAADYSSSLVKLNPYDYPLGFYYNAVAHFHLDEYEEALVSAREAVRLDPLHEVPPALQLLGVLLSLKGDYAGAAAQYRTYIEYAPPGTNLETVERMLADVESKMRQEGPGGTGSAEGRD